jgi:hypothetical protein
VAGPTAAPGVLRRPVRPRPGRVVRRSVLSRSRQRAS